MDPVDFILPHIQNMHGYVPGAQRNQANIIKLNSNENPFGASPAVLAALTKTIEQDPLQKYPEPRSLLLREAIARRYKVGPEQILIGNGSDEILSILFRAMLAPGDTLIVPDPTYSLYPVLTDILNAKIHHVPVHASWQIDFTALLQAMEKIGTATSANTGDGKTGHGRVPLVVFAHPNAPTGLAETKNDIINFIKQSPCPVLVDEAYADFGPFSMGPHVGQSDLPGLMVCGTFSKSFSLAGLRVGWLIAPQKVIAELDKIRDSYNINRLTQVAALAAVQDTDTFDQRVAEICATRDQFILNMSKLGFHCLQSQTNFVFASAPAPHDTTEGARSYFEYLESQNILIRYFNAEKLSRYVRISIGSAEQMQIVLNATQDWLQQG